MRICHVITRLIVGGAQENTLLTCEGLVEKGHDVTLIAGPETGPEGSLWPWAESRCGRAIRLKSLRRNDHPYYDLCCRRHLRGIFGELKCDVVHTHSSKAGIVGRWAAREAMVPALVHTIQGMSFNRTQPLILRWFYRSLERRAARYTDAFVTVAQAMTDQALAARLADGDRFATIYSGMRTDRFGPNARARRQMRQRWQAGPDTVVVGTVARLFANKGSEDLLAAVPRVLRQVPDLLFVWVGGGPNRRRYERVLKKAGVCDRVRFTGLVDPDEMPTVMNGFDLLVHTSRWEGLPRAAVQALLTEIPVISYAADGAPEVVVPGKTGELAPLGNVDALVTFLVHLANSPVLRRNYGRYGRTLCMQRFDHNHMVQQLETLYTRLLEQKRGLPSEHAVADA